MMGKIAMTRTLSGLFLAGLLVDLFLVSGLNFVLYELICFQVIPESWWFWQQVLSFTLSLGLAALAAPLVFDWVFRFENNVPAVVSLSVHVAVAAILLSPLLGRVPAVPFLAYVMCVLWCGIMIFSMMILVGVFLRNSYFQPIEGM